MMFAEFVSADAFTALKTDWRDLTERALSPNVFMDPCIASAACELDELRVLLVWRHGDGQGDRTLMGAWVLALGTLRSWLPLGILRSPVNGSSFFGAPVLDGSQPVAVLKLMMESIRDDESLPNIFEAHDLPSGPVLDALRLVLDERRMQIRVLGTRRRAVLARDSNASTYLSRSLSKQRRKSLKKRRRHLENLGRLELTTADSLPEIVRVFEEFVLLERSGWKGMRRHRGRAMMLSKRDLSFARNMIAGLARDGSVDIHALKLDDRSIALQVILRSGGEAWTWKTAYDESLRHFAPGVLLLEDCTRRLLNDPMISAVDSCNANDQGVMGEFWTGRREIADVIIGTRSRDWRFWTAYVVCRGIYSTKSLARWARARTTFLRTAGNYGIAPRKRAA